MAGSQIIDICSHSPCIKMTWILRCCFIIAGASIWIWSAVRWDRGQRPTMLLDGEVTRVEQDNSGEFPSYRHMVRYQASDEEAREFLAIVASQRRLKEGDPVWVYLDGTKPCLYDPELGTRNFAFSLLIGAFFMAMACGDEIDFQ